METTRKSRRKLLRNIKNFEYYREFSGVVEGSFELSRLGKILSFIPISSSYTQKNNITWAIYSNNTLEVLMETHFAHCEVS